MENPTQVEIDAMMAAGDEGGKYLDAIGKADKALCELEYDEFMCFVEAICTGYKDKIVAAGAFVNTGDGVPF